MLISKVEANRDWRSIPSLLLDLLHSDELSKVQYNKELILQTQRILVHNLFFYLTKKKNNDLRKWPVIDKHQIKPMKNFALETYTIRTNGSTTGKKFSYPSWKPANETIERKYHYQAILREYGMADCKSLLMATWWNQVADNIKTCMYPISYEGHQFHVYHGSILISSAHRSHGINTPDYHHIVYPTEATQELASRFIVDYCTKHPVDIFLTEGSFLACLRMAIKNKCPRLFRLISNTCEAMMPGDAEFFIKQGITKYVCDHMRCNDGGATFITCCHGTKHLLDYISYVECYKQKLVSTDYFSLACPFVRYWSGDMCEIKNEWRQCKCGRYYRSFNLRPRRISFTVLGRNKEKISSLSIADRIDCVNLPLQLLCQDGKIEVITNKTLEDSYKKYLLKNLEQQFILTFTVGPFKKKGKKTFRVIKDLHDK